MNEVLGLMSVVLGITGYIPYIYSIIKEKTTPHVFTWFIWTLLMGIAFSAQWVGHAGAGSWVTGISTVGCFVIFLTALKKGKHDITRSDTVTFISAILSIPIWYFTKNPFYTVIIITIIDILAFYPTLRKSYNKPQEENLFFYISAGLKFLIALFIMDNFTLVTTLYPMSLVILNGLFVVMIYWRRKTIKGS